MDRIGMTKNGLLLFLYMLFILHLCFPTLCLAGIVKREIDLNGTTTKSVIDDDANKQYDTTTKLAATKSTSTEENSIDNERIKTTTQKYSDNTILPPTNHDFQIKLLNVTKKFQNLTTSLNDNHNLNLNDTVTNADTLLVNEKEENYQNNEDNNNNNDDDEVDDEGYNSTTTEPYHFDLSRYTKPYKINLNDSQNDNNYNDIDQLQTQSKIENNVKSDQIDPSEQYNKFDQLILTTPATAYFDEKHREYENDKSYEKLDDDNNNNDDEDENTTDDELRKQNYSSPQISLNDIKSNSTDEKNSSTYYNNSEIESTNYDLAANEIINSTIHENGTVATGEKRAKFMQDPSSDVNLTIPNTAEVWALASMKNVEHTKNREGVFYNVTTTNKQPVINNSSKNGTSVLKQIADWAGVMKHTDYTNNTFVTNDTIYDNIKTQPLNVDSNPSAIQDSASQENHLVAVKITTLPPTINQKNNLNQSTSSENKIDSTRVDDLDVEILAKNKISVKKENLLQNGTDLDFNRSSSSSIVDDVTNSLSSTDDKVDKKVVQTVKFIPKVTTSEPTKGKTKIVHNTVVDADEPTTTETTEIIYSTNAINQDVFDQTTISEEPSTSDDITPDDEHTTYSEISTSTTISHSQKPTHQKQTSPLTTTDLPPTTTITEDSDATTMETIKIEDDDEITTEGPTTEKNIEKTISTTEYETLQSQPSTLQPHYVEKPKTTTSLIEDNSVETNSLEHNGKITETNQQFLEPTTPVISHSSTTDGIDEDDVLTNGELDNKLSEHDAANDQKEPIDRRNNGSAGHNVENSSNKSVGVEQAEESSDTSSTTTDEFNQKGPDVNAIIAITVSVVGVICLALLVGFLFLMRKRQKQLTYAQRCRPVDMDAYQLDNVSVYNSVRRKGVLRTSKRSYGNAAFDDPALKNNLLTIAKLAGFVQNKHEIYDEFKELPTVTARADEVPAGCESKNRYANIVPLPETRVYLKRLNDDEKSEYINANFVKGPKDSAQYYIACQAPLENTVIDFWRMIWEQNSRVIIMATDLTENGIEKCAEYLPASVVSDNHVVFGDFQITLKNREVKEKYAVSTIHLKNLLTNTWRECTHLWYQWPDTGIPSDEATTVAMLLEARSYLKMPSAEQIDDNDNHTTTTGNGVSKADHENGLDKTKSLPRVQGPLTVHCSPGTGRTGTIIACDIAIRALEQPTRSVDIPQIVYFVRRGRASAVRTREQYEFIYKVANIYATKLTGPTNEN